MADNRVQVDIVAENEQLKAKLAESEALLAAAGQKGGKDAARGLDEATKSAGVLSKTLRLIAIPAIAFEAAQRLTNWILDATEKTKTLKKEADDAAKAFLDASRNAQMMAAGGPRRVEKSKLAEDARATIAELDRLEDERKKAAEQALKAELADINSQRGMTSAERNRQRTLAIDEAERNQKAIKKEFDDRRKAVTEGRAKEQEARDDPVKESLRSRVAAKRIDLETDPEKKAAMQLAEDKKRLAIEFKGEENKEILALAAELERSLTEIAAREGAKRAAAVRRQYEEALRAVQRSQTSGFGLNGGGPPSIAGTATALQFLTDNIASFARTQGGGR